MKTILSLIAAAAILHGCATPSQIAVDAEVRRLCAIDGGIKVYETVKLPAERFDRHGAVQIPDKEHAKPGDEYFYDWTVSFIREGNPSLRRDHFRVIRRSDGKVLGEDVSYARRGGDIKGPWHDSSYRCPAIETQHSLEASIFVNMEKQ